MDYSFCLRSLYPIVQKFRSVDVRTRSVTNYNTRLFKLKNGSGQVSLKDQGLLQVSVISTVRLGTRSPVRNTNCLDHLGVCTPHSLIPDKGFSSPHLYDRNHFPLLSFIGEGYSFRVGPRYRNPDLFFQT